MSFSFIICVNPALQTKPILKEPSVPDGNCPTLDHKLDLVNITLVLNTGYVIQKYVLYILKSSISGLSFFKNTYIYTCKKQTAKISPLTTR